MNFTTRVCTALMILLMALAPVGAEDDRLQVITVKFAQQIHLNETVNELIASGLSPDDAEQISNDFALDIASCVVDAMIRISEEDLVPRSDVLDQIEAFADSSDVAALAEFDSKRIEEEASTCAYDAAAEAGIELSDKSN